MKWKFEIKKYTILFVIVLFTKKHSIHKSCVWVNFFQGMVIEMVFNNKIQIFFFSV
jgi:hypothetical protein